MADRAWKRNEREIAKYIGHAERVPITGRQRGDRPDIEHYWLSIEAKLRESLPAWIHDAMRQAEAAARPRQLPVTILRQKGTNVRDALVVIRLEEFREWFL